MKLGFYYHTPVHVSQNGSIFIPSYLGLFIDSLANEVTELICFMHTKNKDEHTDYELKNRNVRIVSLGPDAAAYKKTFLYKNFLTEVVFQEANLCDHLLMRGPSPLTPFFSRGVDKKKLVYLIVGSYEKEVENSEVVWYKKWAIKKLLLYIHKEQYRALKDARILVNSSVLEEELKPLSKLLKRIYTTTLSENDFYRRENTCLDDKIKLLFVGRIDWAKGLKEFMTAFQTLSKTYDQLEWHIVGWEYDKSNPVSKAIQEWAAQEGLAKKLFFHGKKQAGPELLAFYRKSDIYVIPSYHEGFPRTIWEALASSTPVVATKVGSIPSYLKDGENAVLIDPKNAEMLIDGITKLIEDSNLRVKLIQNGMERVKEITLEKQAENIVNFISNAEN